MGQIEQTDQFARVTFPLQAEWDADTYYRVLVPIPPLPSMMIESAVRGLAASCLQREIGNTMSEDEIARAVDGLTIEWGVTHDPA